jgi:hypothetical protein
MLVGPPSALKTAFLRSVCECFSSALPLSDINTTQLQKMKSAMAALAVRTLVLIDMQKIEQRAAAVASNLLGNLAALVDEGYSGARHDTNMMVSRTLARCGVLGGLTDHYYEQSIDGFVDTGFARRFLWAQIRLEDPAILAESVIRMERLILTRDQQIPPVPVFERIPMSITLEERKELSVCVAGQPGAVAIALQLIIKIAAVLRWWYTALNIQEDPIDTVFEFARCLGRNTEPSAIVGFEFGNVGSQVRFSREPIDIHAKAIADKEFSNETLRRRAATKKKQRIEERRKA